MFPVLKTYFWNYSYTMNDALKFENKTSFNSITKALDLAMTVAMGREGTVISFHIYSN
jgi:hypothetical protein